MADENKFKYYVAFLGYAIKGNSTFLVPGHDYYVTNAAVETEDQIEFMRQVIKDGLGYGPEYITLLHWRRIQ